MTARCCCGACSIEVEGAPLMNAIAIAATASAAPAAPSAGRLTSPTSRWSAAAATSIATRSPAPRPSGDSSARRVARPCTGRSRRSRPHRDRRRLLRRSAAGADCERRQCRPLRLALHNRSRRLGRDAPYRRNGRSARIPAGGPGPRGQPRAGNTQPRRGGGGVRHAAGARAISPASSSAWSAVMAITASGVVALLLAVPGAPRS